MQFRNPATHFRLPALQFLNPAMQLLNPAMQFRNPARQLLYPAMQFRNPAMQLLNPATQFCAASMASAPQLASRKGLLRKRLMRLLRRDAADYAAAAATVAAQHEHTMLSRFSSRPAREHIGC